MRLTKDNIDKYLDDDGDLNLFYNKKITHIDYIPDNIKFISITHSNVKEITCKLPDGLKIFYCNGSKLTSLPLLPKSLKYFDGGDTKLPIEYQVYIYDDNIDCNRLRKLQMINSL